MDFREYLSDISHGNISFEQLPPEQCATEESLQRLEAHLFKIHQTNEMMLERSKQIAAAESLVE